MLENLGSSSGVGPASDESDWSHADADKRMMLNETLAAEICNLISANWPAESSS